MTSELGLGAKSHSTRHRSRKRRSRACAALIFRRSLRRASNESASNLIQYGFFWWPQHDAQVLMPGTTFSSTQRFMHCASIGMPGTTFSASRIFCAVGLHLSAGSCARRLQRPQPSSCSDRTDYEQRPTTCAGKIREPEGMTALTLRHTGRRNGHPHGTEHSCCQQFSRAPSGSLFWFDRSSERWWQPRAGLIGTIGIMLNASLAQIQERKTVPGTVSSPGPVVSASVLC